jgi:nucleoside-diphosphate-sugar epimerase
MNLIVGGTGFVGGHLAEYFFAQGEISKGIFRKGSHLRILDQCGVQCIEADLSDRSTLHEPLEMVDVVYNLASPQPGSSEQEFARFNDEGLGNLLEEAREHGVKTFVQLSTLDVHGFRTGRPVDANSPPKPTDGYHRAKLKAEEVVATFGAAHPELSVRIVRAAKAIGARDPSLATPILRMAAQNKTVVFPGGSTRRMSFSHPKDIAQALLKTASSGEKKKTTTALSIKSFDASATEVANSIARAAGVEVKTREQGFLSGRPTFDPYTVEQVKAGLLLNEQEGPWKEVSYLPSYDLGKVAAEIAEWERKEPWVASESG